jgi:hypothetical protein
MLRQAHIDKKGGERTFAAPAIIAVLSREAVNQTCRIGSYKISK